MKPLYHTCIGIVTFLACSGRAFTRYPQTRHPSVRVTLQIAGTSSIVVE